MVKEMQKDVNVLLLKQQIPFMLNVSHYMTDLVYTLYYTIKLQDEQSHILELEGRKTLLCDEIYKLREQFRNLLNQSSGSMYIEEDGNSTSSKDIIELIQQFKNLMNEELLQIVRDTNNLLIIELDKQNDNDINKLKLQLDNCLYGFLNLVTFIRKIPLKFDNDSKNQDSNNRESMESIVNVIKDELLLSWKIELDLLNCKIFNLISKNVKIIKLFQDSINEENIDSIKEDSETFIKLINWLKDDQVFGSIVL
ncbi:similar to Saccharomyces cerevisiae YJR011C Putative protein of unknown function [Maudiozyma saulgeensis]|uniref:Uncharacterized protein n=1 Tax=Maudiozyma saulgeensis TaxID=1789683 RepID=A0A1X7R565_9SACH|nr:similar to Saccharomyces cerevisiae YJR011C Putative protein of unknown function [Kazachstania saulgeensis]